MANSGKATIHWFFFASISLTVNRLLEDSIAAGQKQFSLFPLRKEKLQFIAFDQKTWKKFKLSMSPAIPLTLSALL